MLANIGSTELVVIVLVLIVMFGTSKITGLARSLGETSRELKKVQNEYDDALQGKPSKKDVKKETKRQDHESDKAKEV